jgi:hypothetical protein
MLFPEASEIHDDEELIKLMEKIRKLGVAGHDELDELAGLIKAKVARYGRSQGMSYMAARWWGRQVAMPLVRSAQAMLAMAAYARVGKNRFEAFVVAIDEDAADTDFKVNSRKPRS